MAASLTGYIAFVFKPEEVLRMRGTLNPFLRTLDSEMCELRDCG
jgi:hypothetical protein